MSKKKLDIGWTRQEVNSRLDTYNKTELDRHFKPYTKAFLKGEANWLFKQEERIKQAALEAVQIGNSNKNAKWAALAFNAVPFLHPECFKRFVKYLPKDAQTILEYVALNGSIDHKELKSKFGIEGAVKSRKPDWQGNYKLTDSPELRFFENKNPNRYYSYTNEEISYSLSLEIRGLVLPLLFPEPLFIPPYEPQPDRAEEKMLLGESLIQEELPGLLIRLQQKPLKLTKKGRPSIASVRSISKKLKIQEFYSDTKQADLQYIRSSSLIGLLALSKKLKTDNLIELTERLFDHEFLQGFHLPIHMFGYMGGISKLNTYYITNQGTIYKDLIKGLPVGQWMGYEEIELSLKRQGFFKFPIARPGMYDLYLEVPDQTSEYGFMDTVSIHPDRTEKLVLWPSFRATLFFMASWGLIDIIYEEPDFSIPSITADSPYDGIRAIRLNDLGAFVLGKTSTYESKVKAPFTLKLADDSLSILLTDGDLERAAMAIASFAKPFGNKRFYTDAKLFLGDCKSPADLDHKIQIFTTVFSEKLPANWEVFFEEIKQKVNPLEEEKDFAIFRVDQDNRSLLQLIVRDPELKRLSLKAEGFLILIAKKDIQKFRKRLQTFGYLLE